MVAKSNVTRMDRKAKGFAAFKLNSARKAMEAEFRARVVAAGVARAKEAFSMQINRNRRQMQRGFLVWRQALRYAYIKEQKQQEMRLTQEREL